MGTTPTPTWSLKIGDQNCQDWYNSFHLGHQDHSKKSRRTKNSGFSFEEALNSAIGVASSYWNESSTRYDKCYPEY